MSLYNCRKRIMILVTVKNIEIISLYINVNNDNNKKTDAEKSFHLRQDSHTNLSHKWSHTIYHI